MSRPLRVGVQLPEVERRSSWPELLTWRAPPRTPDSTRSGSATTCCTTCPDGVTRGPWEVWTSLAALAAVTTRVELGPLVASTGFHAPRDARQEGGHRRRASRVAGCILGLGAGWNEREYRAFGFPFDHRVSRFEEAFTIIRTLLREGRVDFHGGYYDIDDCVLDPGPAVPAARRSCSARSVRG